ncbi:MAG: transglycosylase SLT domain-containing protein [Candidatus Hydrogenedentes bacterium]|nr:transglycosylase SLT domain-containing protein [Candidatus Hydrogenedentota bacterium]
MGFIAVLVGTLAVALPGEEPYLAGYQAERGAKFREALEAYQACSDLEGPLQPYAKVRMASCRRAAGYVEAARVELQKIVAESASGPWVRLAAAELAEWLMKEKRLGEAVPFYDAVLEVPLHPPWLEKYEWQAADAWLQLPGREVQAFDYFRRVLETSRYRARRLEAANRLTAAPGLAERFAAATVRVRYGEYRDAELMLLSLMPALSGQPEYLATWKSLQGQLLIGTGHRAEGRALLTEVADNNAGTAWAAKALGVLARDHFAAKEFEAATATFERLARECPNRDETGDALWWRTERLVEQDQRREAAVERVRLAEVCPDYYRADDALLSAAQTFTRLGETEDALKAYARLIEGHPRSPYFAQACFRSGRLFEGMARLPRAREAYRRALEAGLGDYFAHRARARLTELDPDGFPPLGNLRINGHDSFLQLFEVSTPEPDPVPLEWQDDARFQRLAFFGTHGLEEGEWEALDLSVTFQNAAVAAKLYQTLAATGFVHTALAFAEQSGWGIQDGRDTPERLRLRYPQAYWTEVQAAATEAGGIDPLLLLAVGLQESTFRARVVSHAGAVGVMQVMPGTAKYLEKIEPAITADQVNNLESPRNSLRLGAYYLMRMIERMDGNLILAVAAYNAGPGNVAKWRNGLEVTDPDTFIDKIPLSETCDFVKRVLGNYAAYHSIYGGRG